MTSPDRHTLLSLLPVDLIEPAYSIVSECDDHFPCLPTWCRRHASMVARVEAIASGERMVVLPIEGEASDNAERCPWHDCGVALDGGGLSDEGIDSALGLTEANWKICHMYPAELRLAYQSMLSDDLRWEQWIFHAMRLTFRNRRMRARGA